MITVKSVEAKDNYILKVTFQDKKVKYFDMKPYLELPIYQELKEKGKFEKVFVLYDTVSWPNGIDMDPETLYEDGVTL